MALHIQMSEEAEAELRKNALKNKLSSVGACLLFMLMGFGILYFTAVFIVGDTPVSFLAYTPPSEDGPPTNNPTPRELTSRSSPASSAVAPSVIVATSAASVSMAPVEIDMSEGLSLDSSLDLGLGMGTDLGDGLGDGGSGLGSGSSGGSALTGTLYDLKQTGKGRRLKPTDIKCVFNGGSYQLEEKSQPLYYGALANFVQKGWSSSQLSKYYESPDKLFASNFYLPSAKAEYACVAFGAGDPQKDVEKWLVKPAGWCVVYRGKVRAPKTGKFRFIGTGDDYLGVRFDRKLVLSAGYRLISHYDEKTGMNSPKFKISEGGPRKAFYDDVKAKRDPDHKGYELINTIGGNDHWNRELGGMTAGTEFSVEEGKSYPIEILIAESGGFFGFALFIEDVTDGKNSKARKYELFRTNFSTPNVKELEGMIGKYWDNRAKVIEYNEDSLIWTVVP